MSNKAKYLRFTKDYSLPINIFNDELFSYYRELYKDFWPVHEENLMNNEIEQLDGNVDAWLATYATIRDNIINTLEASDKYQEFNNKDISMYDIPNIGLGEHSLYSEETDGKMFISLDLKKANFQALKYVGVLPYDSYEEFIKVYGGTEYFSKSKYLRQVIFGKLNPKRQIKVEKFLIYQLYLDCIREYGFTSPYSLNSDELVFNVNENNVPLEKKLKYIEEKVKFLYGIDVRVEVVKIKRLPIVNSNGNKVDCYIRKNIYTGEEKLKKASTTFFPQIWKLYKGLEITEKDRMFFFEDQIATFNENLKLAEKND